jgi:hypothetical protein
VCPEILSNRENDVQNSFSVPDSQNPSGKRAARPFL